MVDYIENFFGMTDTTTDPRYLDLFLMGSPLTVTTILTLYALFVKKLGPSLMRNREAFNLRGVIILYNLIQVIVNAYIFALCVPVLYEYYEWGGYCLRTSNPVAIERVIPLNHMYYLLKVFDLLDTVFFVLRKSYNQITFLHFYHHVMMCVASFLGPRQQSASHLEIVGFLNCFVHVIMYFYYLVSSLWPEQKHLIWWKKYITLVQIGQFLFLTGYLLYPIIHGDECGYPLKFVAIAFTQNIIMLVLFSNFYLNAYIVKKKTNKD